VPFDVGSQLGELLDWLANAIASLGFFLPIAVILLFNMFGKKDKDKRETQPSAPSRRQATPTQRQQGQPPTPVPGPSFPFGPPSWMEMETAAPAPPPKRARTVAPPSQWGSGFSERRDDDGPLRWGSAFDANDAEHADHALKWGSAFDNQREKTKFGFDDTQWKSGFASKSKESEPKITVG